MRSWRHVVLLIALATLFMGARSYQVCRVAAYSFNSTSYAMEGGCIAVDLDDAEQGFLLNSIKRLLQFVLFTVVGLLALFIVSEQTPTQTRFWRLNAAIKPTLHWSLVAGRHGMPPNSRQA
jgi:Na+/proline symporter